MTNTRAFAPLPQLLFMATLLILMAIVTAVVLAQPQSEAPVNISQPANSDELFCRFGTNALEDPNLTDLPGMGIGWYMNFKAQNNPPRPEGMEYMPTIRFDPANNSKGYTYTPSGSELTAVIASNAGAKWLISNEPDSEFQDNLTPERYARAYHELYNLIKNEDPTAKIIAGSIIQATPIRLEYLDRVLVSYYEQFGHSMPTDGWSIHNYILREVDCDYYPTSCWGAFIPPGVNATNGELLEIVDHDRMDIFTERIVRFRQWLAERGYRGQPVYLTEYGILFTPAYVDGNNQPFFPIDDVNDFMTATFNYMNSATDPYLGDPNDGYRLVQQWSWFSTTEDNFGGTLFTTNPYMLTETGQHYADYITDNVTPVIDFYPSHISGFAITEAGMPVDVAVSATIANSGNLIAQTEATVRFYNSDPQNGGTQLGSDQTVQLGGCGANQTVSATWPDLLPGVHTLYVQVIPGSGVVDQDETNNLSSYNVLVATETTWLPLVARGLPLVGN